jgi:pyruvate dehydrogenase E2 component (dihydrolipoamide acetyltransferase)
MFGKRKKKKDKKRAEWDAAAALLEAPETPFDLVLTPESSEALPAPDPEQALQPAALVAPAVGEPLPAAPPPPPAPVAPVDTAPAPVAPAPVAPAAPVAPVPGSDEPPPVRYFADEVPAPVFQFAPEGATAAPPADVVEHAAVEAPPVTVAPEPPAPPAPTVATAPVAPVADAMALAPVGTRTIARPDSSRALAERMRSSQHEMAQLSMHMDAWMDQAVELRTQLIAEWDDDGLRPSYTDFVVRAVARALIRHPQLNSVVHEQDIELLGHVDVGITTPLDGAFPLLVIRGADRHSLKDITAESTHLAAAHDPATSTGHDPTFIVASLGAYGVDAFTPIVLAPNVATLGIGRVRDETRWEGDRPVRASIMTLTLSWDHRALGGAVAAEFLADVREVLEQPYRLLVD